MTPRTAVPAVILVFFILGMVLPSVRLRLQTGKSAFVLHREANPVQRVIGVLRFGTERLPETFLIDSAGRAQQLFHQA